MTEQTGMAGGRPPILQRNKLRWSLVLTLLLVALNLVAFNMLMARRTGLRLDLTQEGLYSITPATHRLLASLDDDVLIHGYFSRRTHPKLAPLVPQIEDLLAEYAALSGGRVKYEILDPNNDEMAEQVANDRFGVNSTPFRLASKYETGIVNAYFALVIQRGDQYERYGFDELIKVERLPDGDADVHLRNLEYDLTRAIKKVVYGFNSTADLFARVEAPVRLIAIMTPDSLPEILSQVPEAMRTAAQELEEKGGDKFEYEEIDPSDEILQAEVARMYGAGPMSLGIFSEGTFYLYGFLQVGDRVEQLNLVVEDITSGALREAIESALRRQAPGFLKTVGIVAPSSGLPPEIMAQLQMQGRMPQQPPPEFQQVKQYLGRDYQVTDVQLESPDGVPSVVDVLLVIKPKNLSERALYNLDQYLMRGGRVILCASRFETTLAGGQLQVLPIQTGLEDWLASFGIDLRDTMVLDDRNQPLPIPEVRRTVLGNIRTWTLKPYPYLVEVRDDGLVNPQVTARLNAVGIYWGSPLVIDEEKTTDLEVMEILRSSQRSWTSSNLMATRSAEYEVPPADETEPHLLAVALGGRFKSFFAEKGAPRADVRMPPEGEEFVPPRAEVPLTMSPETRLVVVGNAAFISDLVGSLLSQAGGGFFAENLAFVENLIDWTTLDNDLVSIRARGAGTRRLERLDPGSVMVVEGANYVLPALLLLALGGYRFWKRRHTIPVVAVAATSRAGTRRSRES